MRLHIRAALLTDVTVLDGIAAAMGAHHEKGYFERCLQEQTASRRLIFIALHEEHAVGYVQLNWCPVYALFRRLDVPEIQDLNIIPAARVLASCWWNIVKCAPSRTAKRIWGSVWVFMRLTGRRSGCTCAAAMCRTARAWRRMTNL